MNITIEEVQGAVARGWCSPSNSHKEMDATLAFAIADEVYALLQSKLWKMEHREHITDGTLCWCNPETTYIDPETDLEVIVHKEPQ